MIRKEFKLRLYCNKDHTLNQYYLLIDVSIKLNLRLTSNPCLRSQEKETQVIFDKVTRVRQAQPCDRSSMHVSSCLRM